MSIKTFLVLTVLFIGLMGFALTAAAEENMPSQEEPALTEKSETPETPPEWPKPRTNVAPETIEIPALSASPADQGTTTEEPSAGLHVDRMVICRDVVDMEPVGQGDIFPGSVDQLYCHSLVLGAREEPVIHHVWYWNDQKMADVPLSIRSSRFRTYSSKKILPHWKGTWRVELIGPNGELLSTAAFNLE